MSRSSINRLVDNWATGSPGYGFKVKHPCDTVSIRDGVNTRSRHAITAIDGPFGAPRNMIFSGLISNDTTSTSAIDTHSSGKGIVITGCLISEAIHDITVRARNVTVKGNRISATVNNGILMNENGRGVVISNNDLVACIGYGIRVGASGSTHSNVEIRDNTPAGTTGDTFSSGTDQNDLRIGRNFSIRTNKYGIDVDASCTDVLIERKEVMDVSLKSTVSRTNSTGTQAAGLFDIFGNIVKQKANLMNRALYTTRTQVRLTGHRA